MSIDPARKAAWLREFELNGFIVFRGFLPPELVGRMHDELMPLLEAEYAKASADGFSKGRAKGRLSLHVGPYAEMFKGALADALYQRNPVVEELVDALMGPGRWSRGRTAVEAVWKGSEFMTWHPDQAAKDTPDPDGPHEVVRVTFNIPLVDFTWANGAMELIPGSHRVPFSFHDHDKLLAVRNLYPVLPQLGRGDAMLRDGNLLHRGTPNVTDHPRPMLDQTYKRKTG